MYKNLSWYQLNFQVSLETMEMVVGGKYMTTCLGKLDLLGGNSNIGHHVLKKLDNKTGKIMLDMD